MKQVITIQDLLKLKKGDILNVEQNALITPAAQDLATSTGIVIQRSDQPAGSFTSKPKSTDDLQERVRNLVREHLGEKKASPEAIEYNVRLVLEHLRQQSIYPHHLKQTLADQKQPSRSDRLPRSAGVSHQSQPHLLISVSGTQTCRLLSDFMRVLVSLDLDLISIEQRIISGFIFVNVLVLPRTAQTTIASVSKRISDWAQNCSAHCLVRPDPSVPGPSPEDITE
ncbi:hypothetical protein JXQ70_14345 [bacterium]|nr:hypothetical protein [bacterium]